MTADATREPQMNRLLQVFAMTFRGLNDDVRRPNARTLIRAFGLVKDNYNLFLLR